jgi:hypothetical protein
MVLSSFHGRPDNHPFPINFPSGVRHAARVSCTTKLVESKTLVLCNKKKNMENADFMIEIYRKSKQLDRDLDVCFMIGYDKEIHKANHRP